MPFPNSACLQMDSGGGWEHEAWADLSPERNIRLQPQGRESRPWMLERRRGLARDIYNRIKEDGRFVDTAMSNEIRYCMNAMLNHGGCSAYQLVVGSNPVDLHPWEDYDRDLHFVQNTSVSSQFTQQWKLRVTAQGARGTGPANGKLRRIMDRNQTFNSIDIAIGDSVIFHKQISR